MINLIEKLQFDMQERNFTRPITRRSLKYFIFYKIGYKDKY